MRKWTADAASVERIVQSYADLVFRIAFHYMGNRADAEDIVHDVLLKWLEQTPAFSGQEHEKAWFIRVAINACKDRKRSAYRRKTVGLDACRDVVCMPESSLIQELISLPADDRTVLYLHYYEGYSIKEIARIVKKSDRAVQSRLYRARQKLKERLEEAGDDGTSRRPDGAGAVLPRGNQYTP